MSEVQTAAFCDRASRLLGNPNNGRKVLQDAQAVLSEVRAPKARARVMNVVGSAMYVLGQNEAAVAAFVEADSLDPDGDINLVNAGNILYRLRRYNRARAAFSAVLSRGRDSAAAVRGMSRVEIADRKYDQALPLLKRLTAAAAAGVATQDNPAPDVCQDLAAVYYNLGRHDKFLAAHALIPGGSEAQDLLLPEFYSDVADIHAARERFQTALARSAPTPLMQKVKIGLPLSYHGDPSRQLLEHVADRYRAELGSAVLPPISTPRRLPPCSSYRIRVGFLSSNFHNHSVSKDRRGIIANLDRSVFEVLVFAFRQPHDLMSNFVARSADRFVVLPGDFRANQEALRQHNLDILVFADIGMDVRTYCLALGRHAPVQLTTWGHSDTSGLDSIDGFVSSSLFEGPEAQSRYTEKLLLLDSLSTYYYRPPDQPPRSRCKWGLPTEAHTYLVPATFMKMHPIFDAYLQGILADDPCGVIVLIRDPKRGLCKRVMARLARKLGRHLACRLHTVPFQESYADFLALLASVDVVLDTYPFGGCNVSFEAFAAGKAVVTQPSQQLSGRFTQGLYRAMGVDGLVVHSRAEYIRTAVRLCYDPSWRADIEAAIRETSHKLFEEANSVRDWEGTLKEASGRELAPLAPLPMPSFIDLENDVVIVGNGCSAASHPLGDVIDGFRSIYRFNNYRTRGYEAFVGTRTTHWVVSDIIPFDQSRYDAADSVYLFAPLVKRRPDGRTQSPMDGMDKVLVTDVHHELDLKKRFYSPRDDDPHHWPSTGMLLLDLISKCLAATGGKAYAVGFDRLEAGPDGSLHYFDTTHVTDHITAYERSMWEAFLASGAVSSLVDAVSTLADAGKKNGSLDV